MAMSPSTTAAIDERAALAWEAGGAEPKRNRRVATTPLGMARPSLNRKLLNQQRPPGDESDKPWARGAALAAPRKSAASSQANDLTTFSIRRSVPPGKRAAPPEDRTTPVMR